MLGLEIRVQVSDYVMDRITALRLQNVEQYDNIACIRTNAMKYLLNYFKKGQLSIYCNIKVLSSRVTAADYSSNKPDSGIY